MNIATVVARIPLGLVFVAAGLSGFIFSESRWVLFVDALEVVAGALRCWRTVFGYLRR